MTEINRPDFAPVDPSAHLPSFSSIAKMPRKEQHVALAAWVAWFNSHQDLVEPELERDLDRALSTLDRQLVSAEQMETLQARFNHWLESAGTVGRGRGPAEENTEELATRIVG